MNKGTIIIGVVFMALVGVCVWGIVSNMDYKTAKPVSNYYRVQLDNGDYAYLSEIKIERQRVSAISGLPLPKYDKNDDKQ